MWNTRMCIITEQGSLWDCSKLSSSGNTHVALFLFIYLFPSSLSAALPYIMTVTKCLIEAFNDLSRATVPFLQSFFYI